jgi:hemolysin activation/secretion protein
LNIKSIFYFCLFYIFTTNIYADVIDINTSKNTKCIVLKQIDLNENKILVQSKQQELFKPYIGNCINEKLLKEILHTLSQFYIDNGYITTKPYLTEQNIKDGQIEISVSKGLIKDIVNDDTNRSDAKIKTAFVFQKGNPLNLRDLETSLEMINRVPSSDAKFEVTPAEEQNSSIVRIKTVKTTPYHLIFGATADQSTKSDKPYVTIDGSVDNPLNINDIFTLRYNTSSIQQQYQNSSGSELDYSFPIGSYLLSFSWFDFKYDQRILGLNNTYTTKGDTKGTTTKISKILFRNQANKLTFALSVQNKDTRNYFSDQLIDVSSYSTTLAQVDVTHTLLQNWGQLTTTYSFYRGTDWFGARNDSTMNQASNINKQAKLQFTKYSLDSNLLFYFTDRSYTLNSNLHLQYSDDFLYDNDKLRVGGYYSVRGYSSSYYGNNGGYINNNLLKTFSPSLNIKYLQTISPFIGIDYGEVQCQSDNVNSCGKLIGGALGFKTDSKTLSSELSCSRALKKVPDQKIENLFRYNLTLKF